MVEDEGRFPKAVMDVLPGLSSMPVGDDVVVSLLLLIEDEGESYGDRRTVRVRDAEGEGQESALSDEIVCVWVGLGRGWVLDFCSIGWAVL